MAVRPKHGKKSRQKEEIEEVEELEELEAEEEKPSRRGRKGGRGKGKEKDKEVGRDSSVIYRDGEMPRLHGKGISFNLALTVSIALAVILLFFGVVIFFVQSSALDKQIDSAGVEAVRVLACPDFNTWRKLHMSNYEERQDDYAKDRDHGKLPENDKQLIEANINRLVPLVKDKKTQILFGQVLNRSREIVISTITATYDFGFNTDVNRRPRKVDEVTVAYGNCFLNKKSYKSRLYACPIIGPDGNEQGTAQIVLSEDQIGASKSKLFLTMLICTVIFIGLGIGVSFFVGRRIAVPVQTLIKDVSIVAKGDLSHHTVPKSQDEIGLLARTFDKMTKNLSEAQSQELELAAQKHQIAVAHEVQAKLLPDVIPQVEGYDIKAYHRSSKEMGGNYYDVIQFPNGQVGAIVASASGKGIPAAMVMTMARSFMRALTHKGDDLSGMIRDCNRLLSPDLRAGMYVEVLMVLVDPATNKGRLISAGPAMLLRFSSVTQKISAVQADGIAMGFDKGPVFDKTLKDVEFDIEPGDRLVLNTQGLFGIKNPDRADLGTKGFARIVVKHGAADSAGFVRRVVNNLDSFAGGEVKDTNITFVTVARKS